MSTLGASSGVDTSAITDLINRISTAESTLQSKANASETYTKSQVDGLVSTLETSMTNLGSSSGLSNSAITDLKNRMSSAESSLTSKANASETYTKTEIDGKITTINTTLKVLGAESGVDTSAITDLVNRVATAETTLQSKADSSTVYTKTEIDGKITTINSSISANSGLKTAADVKSAFDDINETIYTSGTASATLFAKIESDADAKYAGIDVAVRKVNIGTSANPNYQLESGVTVSADNIDFTANNFTIDASKIDLRGEVIFEQLSGTYVTGSSGPIKTSTGSIPGATYLGSVSFDPTELEFVRDISGTTYTTSIQPGYVTTKEVHGDSVYSENGAVYIKSGNGYIML
ncbi:MAG: hypothetical protein VZQ98_11185 [Bacteroidales bacterium]|nr:hypothetical protein [Bacteroidales bacterium]